MESSPAQSSKIENIDDTVTPQLQYARFSAMKQVLLDVAGAMFPFFLGELADSGFGNAAIAKVEFAHDAEDPDVDRKSFVLVKTVEQYTIRHFFADAGKGQRALFGVFIIRDAYFFQGA